MYIKKTAIMSTESTKNPFIINNYQGKEYFCDREHNVESLINNIQNELNTTLISIRRIGKTGLIKFQTGNTGDKKAQKKLKMDAAKQGCPFVLLTADKTTVGANSNTLGASQAIKTGVSYKY